MKLLKYMDIRYVAKQIMREDTAGNMITRTRGFIEKKTKETVDMLTDARRKLKDIPGTNYDFGMHHLRKGNLDDAILRFKMVIYLDPNRTYAYYNLGRAALMKGDVAAAKTNLEKALSLQKNFPEASYVLGKINSPEAVDSIPANLIAEHIEWKETTTENAEELRRQKDQLLVTTTLANIKDKNPNLEVLDLGSANGGRGLLLKKKEVTRKIIGVDLDPKLNLLAAKLTYNNDTVYAKTHTSETYRFLTGNPEKFDLILAGNIFSYQGKLEAVFADIAKSLKQSGIFAAILDTNDIRAGFSLNVTQDKFIHSLEYIETAIKSANLSIVDKKEKDLTGQKVIVIIAIKG